MIAQHRDELDWASNVEWRFDTARYTVALLIEDEEEEDPAETHEFQEAIDAIRNGDVAWFRALVAVYGPDGRLLAYDTLSGCAYQSVQQFISAHRDPDPMNRNCSVMRTANGNCSICHYFPDMVRAAIQDARARS